MMKTIRKSLLNWAGIILLALVNGLFRSAILIPSFGWIGIPISSILLCMMIYMLTYALIGKAGPGDTKTYLLMGATWLALTVCFEILMGLTGGFTFEQILANYAPSNGNLWLVVIVFIGLSPYLAAKRKKLI